MTTIPEAEEGMLPRYRHSCLDGINVGELNEINSINPLNYHEEAT
jgi:hypothetical protein